MSCVETILVHFCSHGCQREPLNMTSFARAPPHASTSCRRAQFPWTRVSSSAALSVTIICIKFRINLAAPPCNYVNRCSKTKCGFPRLFPLNLWILERTNYRDGGISLMSVQGRRNWSLSSSCSSLINSKDSSSIRLSTTKYWNLKLCPLCTCKSEKTTPTREFSGSRSITPEVTCEWRHLIPSWGHTRQGLCLAMHKSITLVSVHVGH